jgi:hypothetical protein
MITSCTIMKYVVTELTKDLWETRYGLLIEQLLKDHGAVEITEDDYGCIIDVCEVQKV